MRRHSILGLTLVSFFAVACGSSDATTPPNTGTAGAAGSKAGAGGSHLGSAGAGGKALGGAGGSAGSAGKTTGGSAGQPNGGSAGSSGQSNGGSSGQSNGGSSGQSNGGSSGQSNGGSSGQSNGAGGDSGGAGDTGSGGSVGGSGDGGGVSTTYPAPHPAAPQILNLGGVVLASPKIIQVSFADSDPTLSAGLESFLQQLAGSDYLNTALTEYGVGAATFVQHVQLTQNAGTNAIDQIAIQQWLTNELETTTDLPAPDENTLFVFDYPKGTIITVQGEQSCNAFAGFHDTITLDDAHANQHVAYVVLPICDGIGTLSTLDTLTVVASGKIAGAATDPYFNDEAAFTQFDEDHLAWVLATGDGEVDACGAFTDFDVTVPGIDNPVARLWSNKAAAAAHDPCYPALGGPYFNAAPELGEVTFAGMQTLGVKIPVGQSADVLLDLFSDADTGGPFDISVFELGDTNPQDPDLTFTLDKSSGQNGEKVKLTITNLHGKSGSAFSIQSQLDQTTNAWIGLVVP